MGVEEADLAVGPVGELVGERARPEETVGIADVDACGAACGLGAVVLGTPIPLDRYHLETHLVFAA